MALPKAINSGRLEHLRGPRTLSRIPKPHHYITAASSETGGFQAPTTPPVSKEPPYVPTNWHLTSLSLNQVSGTDSRGNLCLGTVRLGHGTVLLATEHAVNAAVCVSLRRLQRRAAS